MLLTALMMGIAGGLHCFGMCSPLAVAVTNLQGPAFRNRLLYNGGRILTYGVLGAFFGAFGAWFDFSGIQNTITLTLGAVLIVIACAGIRHLRIPFFTAGWHRIAGEIRKLFARFIQQKSVIAFLAMGILNGLLPCGLTFLALTYCVSLPGSADGFIFMIVFGAGTLPVMLGLTSVLKSLMNRFRVNVSRLTTITMVILGVLLIARGVLAHHSSNAPVTESVVICK